MRVYRPVPPTQHLIINPDGATPLQLNIGDGSFIAEKPGRSDGPLRPVRQRALEGAALRG